MRGSAVLPGKAFHGHRAALGVAQQAVVDLGAVAAVVARVAADGQRAAGPLDKAGGELVQGQAAVAEVALGELALDAGLAFEEPVHGGVEVVDGGIVEVEQVGQGGLAGGAEFTFEAQLGAGLEQAGEDQGQGQRALAAGLVKEDAVEAELAGGAEQGADSTMLAGAAELDGGVGAAEGELLVKGGLEQVDEGLGEGGEIGEGAFLDLAVVPVGFAQEMAGGFAGEGGGDVHCMTRNQGADMELSIAMKSNGVKRIDLLCMTRKTVIESNFWANLEQPSSVAQWLTG